MRLRAYNNNLILKSVILFITAIVIKNYDTMIPIVVYIRYNRYTIIFRDRQSASQLKLNHYSTHQIIN